LVHFSVTLNFTSPISHQICKSLVKTALKIILLLYQHCHNYNDWFMVFAVMDNKQVTLLSSHFKLLLVRVVSRIRAKKDTF